MIDALAPTLRRGCSWVCLSLVLTLAGSLGPVAAFAQEPKPKASGDTTKKAEATPAKTDAAKKDAEKAEPAEDGDAADTGSEATLGDSVEVYKDPRAEKALTVFKTVSGLRDCRPSDISQTKSMAGGGTSPDRETIQRFVDGMAYRLTDKSNINALIAPPANLSPNAPAFKAIKESSANLIDVLATARQAKNTSFLSIYNQALLATLPKLLDNNLITRIEAIIVLGQTGDPNALPIYLAQLKDANQTIWVKLWSARGLTNIVDGGVRDSALSVQQAAAAGKTVSDFLAAEKDAPWPAVVRGLEALGAMRQASVPTSLNKADMAASAMAYLADAGARPEIRSEAVWALGMVRVNPSLSKYNYSLIAFHSGRLSAELGERTAASFSENRTLSEYLTGLLVDPVFQGLNGVEGARESGLLKAPGLGQSQAYVKQVTDLQSAVTRAAVELVRAAPGQVPAKTKDLQDRVTALKGYLEKNPPKDFHLVPDGPEYRAAGGAVAAADGAKVAGPTGGR